MPKLDRSQWLSDLKSVFPQLRDARNAEQGLLAFEMNVFARFTMRMIGEGDRDAVTKCYAIALKFYEGGNAWLRDAIDTCYIEDLEFRKHKRVSHDWAWELMPASLKALYEDFHRPV